MSSTDIGDKDYCAKLAKSLVGGHVKGTLSLAIINTVDRARKVYREVEKEIEAAAKKGIPHALIHSRFRSEDRKRNIDLLLDKEKDRIVVATQVVEAGVDVSAARLITEIAPWPSLVQRFGRCNRSGECNHANIIWADAPATKDGKKGKKNDCSAPYDPAEMESSRKLLGKLKDAGIKSLETAGKDYRPLPAERQVIRKRDVEGLFDTTPDLTGNDLDVSRYIRESDDTDVQVFWRQDVDVKGEDFYYETPSKNELCSIPIGDAKTLVDKPSKGDKSETKGRAKQAKIWRWNPRDDKLELIKNASDVVPGQILLLDCKTGGYNERTGWDAEFVGCCEVEELKGEESNKKGEEDSDESDRLTYVGKNILLSQHTKDVENEVAQLTVELVLEPDLVVALKTAALWHDVGKSHHVFQNMLLKANTALDAHQLWAKSERKGGRYERKHFRHELASALAWLQNGVKGQINANLIAYVIAAHHGKVRLLLRSMPGEKEPAPPASPPYARGVWTGDELPMAPPLLPSGAKLDLSLMELGEGSWLERTLSLRDDPAIGPFRLAYYEMLLRIADWRASEKEESGKNGP